MFLNLGDELTETPAGLDPRFGGRQWSSRWRVEAFLSNGRHFRHYVVANMAPEMGEQRAVLKTIKYDPNRCDDSDYVATLRERLARERETLTHFSPRLPEVIDYFEVENTQDPFRGFGASQLRVQEPILVQTLLHGSSLADLMKDQGAPPAPAEQVLLSLAKVCTFLDELHASGRGWLFSGLTPEHVIVDPAEDLEPRFVGCSNFRMLKGGAAVDELSTSPRVSRPEPGYAAPESLCGARCDGREDVYAVGGLLFHLFTGIDPRGLADELLPTRAGLSESRAMDFGTRLQASMERFCRRNLKGLGIHRARVRKTLLTAVSPDPDERQGSPAELRQELLETLERSMPAVQARLDLPRGPKVP